jgi:hypothetical protein
MTTPSKQNIDLPSQWSVEVGHSNQIIQKIEKILSQLQLKRITLEEKILQRYLEQTAEGYSKIVKRIDQGLSIDTGAQSLILASLTKLNQDVQKVADELLKVINYNLNYLEQYYEQPLLHQLTENYCFPDQLDRLLNQLK